MKNIVITGVSSGIGYGASKEFINRGYRVFGSVRREEDAFRLKNELGERFEPLIFDITDHKAIQNEAKRVADLIGDEGLSGLINNAGETLGGPLLHLSTDTIRKTFEVMVFGQLAVTKSFLPLLGTKRTDIDRGRILMISSTSGKLGFPFVGPYAGSKHALEGISKSLRAELLIYGIDLIVIGPGNINTPIWNKNGSETIEKYRNTDYYPALKKMDEYLKKIIQKEALGLDIFSNKLANIFESKSPKARYTIVKNSLKNWVITKLIPERQRNRLIARKLELLI